MKDLNRKYKNLKLDRNMIDSQNDTLNIRKFGLRGRMLVDNLINSFHRKDKMCSYNLYIELNRIVGN